jgi:hypothetical protein
MKTNAEREHRQAEKARPRRLPEPRDAERSEVIGRLRFTMHRGIADGVEEAEFRNVWARYRGGEITKQQLEEWVTTFNSRPRGAAGVQDMSLVMPEETGGDFELQPEGTHTATCYRVIDLGTQEATYEGKTKKQHKVLIAWELTEEPMSDGRPFTIQKRYTLSSSEKATLRQDLEAWRGKKFTKEELGKFNISRLLKVSCMLGVKHSQSDGKTYADVSSILGMPKGIKGPPLVNEPFHFDLSNFDQSIFDKLSDKLKETIKKSPEYQELMGKKLVSQAADDIPFGSDDDDAFGGREPGQEG